ncbi:hypothetical protein OG965_16635 [Streptomyces sp. NBC_00224]|uniref:Uncharacterized protein n=1 Tax=Streptomyces sp. NBC_00060 TaxID=2975636 RepID=A0AAU2H293_9ACTN
MPQVVQPDRRQVARVRVRAERVLGEELIPGLGVDDAVGLEPADSLEAGDCSTRQRPEDSIDREPERRLDVLDGRAGVAGAQGVGPLDHPDEVTADVIGVQRLAGLSGEDVVAVGPGRPQQLPLLLLPLPMGPQHQDGHRVQRDDAVAVVLGPGDDGLPAHLHDLLDDGERAGIQVNVRPAQPDALTAARPPKDQQVVVGVEPVGGHETEEGTGLFGRPDRHLRTPAGGHPVDDAWRGPDDGLGPRRALDFDGQRRVVDDAALPYGGVERCPERGMDALEGGRADRSRGGSGARHDGVVGGPDLRWPELLQRDVPELGLEIAANETLIRTTGVGRQLPFAAEPLVQPLAGRLLHAERDARTEAPTDIGGVRQLLIAAVVITDKGDDLQPTGVVVCPGYLQQLDSLPQLGDRTGLTGEATPGDLLPPVLLAARLRQRHIDDVGPGAVLLCAGQALTGRVVAGRTLTALIGGALHDTCLTLRPVRRQEWLRADRVPARSAIPG